MSVMTAGTPERLAVRPAKRRAQRSHLRVVRAAPAPAASGVRPAQRSGVRPVPRSAVRPVPRSAVRLTRRGRAVVKILVVMAILLVTGLAWLTGAVRVQAAGSGAPPGSVYRHLTAMVVRPGESLWTLAMQAQPNADPRVVVQEIVDVNALHSSTVRAGERLWVPRG
jgi:LysM domain-containing protein